MKMKKRGNIKIPYTTIGEVYFIYANWYMEFVLCSYMI